jgi:hypothetical protein
VFSTKDFFGGLTDASLQIVLFSGVLSSLYGALSLVDEQKTIVTHCIINQTILGRVQKLVEKPRLYKARLCYLAVRIKTTIGGDIRDKDFPVLDFCLKNDILDLGI